MIADDAVLVRGGRDRRAYLMRTVLAIAAIGLFAVAWITADGIADHPVVFALSTGVVAYHVAVWAARWSALRRMARPRPMRASPGLRVAVTTTFVPETEPIEMLELTVRAMQSLEYPHDTWVLDEGDDPAVRAFCERIGARHFTRKHRDEYLTAGGQYAARSKHGNYNAWLTETGFDGYDVLVTFDVDHIPEPQYLIETLGYFDDDRVAYVQAAPVYYNQAASFIAQGAAEETYAYVSSHQMASYALGHPIIVGSHCAHRVSALREVGGFPAHDAEDLYLTMRYRATRWRGVYLPKILALGTTPVDWPGYIAQQYRWGRAVLDLKLRRLAPIAPDMSAVERLLSLFHGVYFLRPLTFGVALVVILWLLATNDIPLFLGPRYFVMIVALFLVLSGADDYRQRFYLDPSRERGVHWRATVLQLAKWPALLAATMSAIGGRVSGYVTTPKRSVQTRRVLARPHLLVALLALAAANYGAIVHGPLIPELRALAAIVIGASLALVWTEGWTYPQPFDPALWRDARKDMRGVIASHEPPTSSHPGTRN